MFEPPFAWGGEMSLRYAAGALHFSSGEERRTVAKRWGAGGLRASTSMTNDDLARLELVHDKGVLRPSLLAIGLIAAGLTLGMLKDPADDTPTRPLVTVSNRTG